MHDEQIAIGTCENQTFDADKNNPKISGASVTNFHLTLAWAKENFPVLRDLLGPIEPEISIFFRNRQQYFLIQVLTLTQLFFQQINMALNDHSHKMWPQIRILSSMKRWDLGMGH